MGNIEKIYSRRRFDEQIKRALLEKRVFSIFKCSLNSLEIKKIPITSTVCSSHREILDLREK